MELNYYLIDAFTSEPFQGAQIAVFPQADNVSEENMQLIARELNLSETVFVLPATQPRCAYRLRIFSPEAELDFGGHPVIAASHALLMDDRLTQGEHQFELNREQLSVYIESDHRIYFSRTGQVHRDSFVPSANELAGIINLDESDILINEYQAAISGFGDNYLIVPLKSISALHKARFNENKWQMSFVASLAKQILLFTHNVEAEADFTARLLGKGIAVQDDPPIGSAAPAFAAYLYAESADGEHACVLQRGGGDRRQSMLQVSVTKNAGLIEQIRIGGSAVRVASGCIHLP